MQSNKMVNFVWVGAGGTENSCHLLSRSGQIKVLMDCPSSNVEKEREGEIKSYCLLYIAAVSI